LATVTNPASEEFQFGYGDGGLLSKVTTPRGNEYRLTYDAMGRLIRADDPSSGSSALALAAVSNGDQVTLTTAMDRLSSYRRELLPSGDRRRVSRFPDGASLQVLTKVSGSSETTTPSGVTVNQMEGSDPRFGILAPYSASLVINTPGGLNYQRTGNRTVSLADPNNVLSITGETETMTVNGQVYTMTYDGGTKTFREVTPLGRRITSRIDDKGRLVWRQVDGLVPWTYGYDERGRLSVITAGEGDAARTASVTYGPDGYLERITDPLARIFRFERDTAGRVVKKILPGGGQVLYGYEANGNLTAVTPPGRPGHFFAYTPVDLQSQYTWPQVGSENNHTGYLFNLDRQLRRFEWPDGQAMDLGYDSAGRLITASGGSPRDYSYFSPATGNLAGVTTPNQDLSFSYDGTLLVSESWSGTVAGTVGRTYNNNFKPASIRVNEGPPVQFQYDIDNLLTAAGDLILTRNSQNSLITQTRIGNVADFRSYDGFAAIEDYRAAYSGADIYAVQYTRDKLGRITGKTETISGMTDSYQYLYDPAGRLGEVKKNGVTSAQYAYDENGNRLTYSDSVGTVTGGYDAQDRLTQYGSAAFGYTAKGELRSKTVGTQTDSYQYDALGNLTGVTLPDGTQIEYVVDGRNRRVGKKVNGTLVQAFLYKDALKPIAELDGSGNLISLFVYGSKSNVADYMVKGGNTYRIISDHLGSPRMVVEVSTGAVVQRMDYDEFGKVIQNTSPGFQPFGFAGGIYDPDTGLVSFGAREYDSETGRWTKKDPIGFNGRDTNLYAYVQNDPMNFIDPAGLMKGGSMTAPFANPPILLGVGGGLGSFEYSYQTGYEEIMNAIGDWLYEIYIQQGYGPGEAQMMVAQAVMEDFLHSSAGELNLPTSPPLENRLTSGEVLR
jgi:RHS repeat-associated protein